MSTFCSSTALYLFFFSKSYQAQLCEIFLGRILINLKLLAFSISYFNPYPSFTVDVLPARAYKSSSLQYWVGIIIGCVVVIALIALVLLCCCRRRKGSKLKKKAGDMEVSHRGVSSQAPPPPYYTVGRDNKAMDGSLPNGIEDPSKTAIYGSQQPFTYGPVPGQMPNNQQNNGESL